MWKLLLFLIPICIVCACANDNARSDRLLLARRPLPEVPSASGITAAGDSFFVNADNAPFLYILDANGALRDSLVLMNEDTRLHQVPKPLKSDYEAAAIVRHQERDWLLLLGSGSKPPHRDSALLIALDGAHEQRKASLQPFFGTLIASGLPAHNLNIEAAAGSGERLILFNRGNNFLIVVNREGFLNGVFGDAPLPACDINPIILPEVKGFPAGISGACMLNDTTILFCASVEATTDWAKDGDILGSGIGMAHFPGNDKPQLRYWAMLRNNRGELLRDKLEGIEVLRRTERGLILRCVSDNDSGASELLDIQVQLRADRSGT